MPASEATAPDSSPSEASESTEVTGIAGAGDEKTETPGEGEPEGISSAGVEPVEGSEEGGEDEGKKEDGKQEKDEKDEKDPVLDAVPEASDGYAEVEIPEGLEGDDTMLSIYNEGAHKSGLSERQHKSVLDDIVKPAFEHLQARTEEQQSAMVADWKTSLGTDKVLSTAEAKMQIADARNGFMKANPEHAEALMKFLQDTKLEFVPGLNAMFAYTGSLLGEGRMRPGKDLHSGGSGEMSAEARSRRMFPKSAAQG